VIVGCDELQECLLPWWWKNYSAHNDYPVTFCDFGMSKRALDYCQKRGDTIAVKSHVELKDGQWTHHFGCNIDSVRRAWIKKPFALQKASYRTNLWLDLDCEVRGDLDPLFNCLVFGDDVALVSDIAGYNAGVILFKKGAGLIKEWCEVIEHNPNQHVGDQGFLNEVAQAHSVTKLPYAFNYQRWMPPINDPLVIHHTEGAGKEEIVKQCILSEA